MYLQVSWQKVGTQFPLTASNHVFLSNGRYVIENGRPEEWNLIITKVRKSDRGVYQCRVTSRAAPLVREIRLIIKGSKLLVVANS